MLVVMKHWDITAFLQLFFNFKTARRCDVLQIDTAKAFGNQRNRADDFIYIFGINTDWKSVYPAKLFKQGTFSFHNGHGRSRSDISQPQNGSAICNHCNDIRTPGQLKGFFLVFLNLQAGPRHTGSISQRQVFFITNGRTGNNLNFSVPLFMLLQGSFHNIHFVDHLIASF